MKHSDIPDAIKKPFAVDGDKNVIPEESTPQTIADGLAAFSSGFPPSTSLPLTAGGKKPRRQDINGIYNKITLIQRWQQTSAPRKYESDFCTSIGGYPKYSVLAKASVGGFWVSDVDDNVTNPDSGGTGWLDFADFIASTNQAFDISAEIQNSNQILRITMQPSSLRFRNSTLTSGSHVVRRMQSAITIEVPGSLPYTSLGLAINQQWKIAVLAMDIAGVVELAVCRAEIGKINLDETGVISTQTGNIEDGSIYSSTQRSNVSYRVVGVIDVHWQNYTWNSIQKVIGVTGENLTSILGSYPVVSTEFPLSAKLNNGALEISLGKCVVQRQFSNGYLNYKEVGPLSITIPASAGLGSIACKLNEGNFDNELAVCVYWGETSELTPCLCVGGRESVFEILMSGRNTGNISQSGTISGTSNSDSVLYKSVNDNSSTIIDYNLSLVGSLFVERSASSWVEIRSLLNSRKSAERFLISRRKFVTIATPLIGVNQFNYSNYEILLFVSARNTNIFDVAWGIMVNDQLSLHTVSAAEGETRSLTAVIPAHGRWYLMNNNPFGTVTFSCMILI